MISSDEVGTGEQVLKGIRILDFAWVGAGALVTQTFAIHGAEVIKIETSTHPDNLRVTAPFRPGHENVNGSGYFASRNANKYSFALNMATEKAHAIARELLKTSDIVINNFRPGIMERWGLGYEQARALNPGVIYVSMPMQGSTGPHRDYMGFGSTISAVAGIVEMSGLPERTPIGTNTHYPDHVPNPGHALVVLLAALYRREMTGQGANIELAQLESTVSVVGPEILAASLGVNVERTGNRVADSAPHGVFQCSGDDLWIALAVQNDEQWKNLRRVIDTAERLQSPDFDSFDGRKQREDEIEEVLTAYIKTWDRGDLASALQLCGVPAYEVQSIPDLLNDAQLLERGFWRHLDHKEVGTYVTGSLPFRWEGGAFAPTRPAPMLGEHTWELAEKILGMTKEEFDTLVSEGVLI